MKLLVAFLMKHLAIEYQLESEQFIICEPALPAGKSVTT